MAAWLFSGWQCISMPGTSKSFPQGLRTLHQQRLATDPFYLADVTIQNAVIGSSYILLGPDGTTVLSGPSTITTDPQVLSAVPAYGDPYVIELRLRKSTSGTRYVPLKQFVPHNSFGVSFYVVQQEDPVL